MKKDLNVAREFVEGLRDLSRMKPFGKFGSRYYDFLLANGVSKVPAPLAPEEQRLLQVHCAFNPQKKQCFYNAQKISVESRDKIEYIEGYAIKYIPAEHGWNQINKKFVDVTWDNDGVSYFGVRIPKEFIQHNWLETEKAEPLLPKFFKQCVAVKPAEQPKYCGDMSQYKR